MTPPVGADVESLCAKCGDVWHVVVAKVGDRIARVQCKQCGALHRLKPPGGPVAKEPKEKRARAHAAPRREAPPPPVTDGPVRPYSPKESYAAGERVRHPVFGVGVVTGSPGPGKIDVAFPGGPRVLAVARSAPALVRPGERPGE